MKKYKMNFIIHAVVIAFCIYILLYDIDRQYYASIISVFAFLVLNLILAVRNYMNIIKRNK
jgi:hypothetical protein